MPKVIVTMEDGDVREWEDAWPSFEPESREVVICDDQCGVTEVFSIGEIIDMKIDCLEER